MLTDLQKKTAQAIVNIFETSKALGNYGDVTLLRDDPGHLTYGRSQVTLTSGHLFALINAYVHAPHAHQSTAFQSYMKRLQDKDLTLDHDDAFRALLKQAGTDPVMHKVQDGYFDTNFWNPAVSDATHTGLTLPLSIAIAYDSHIQGGWLKCSHTTNEGGTVAAHGEKGWILRYLTARHNFLAGSSHKIVQDTVYRVTALKKLLVDDNWNLELPITVQGVSINAHLFGA